MRQPLHDSYRGIVLLNRLTVDSVCSLLLGGSVLMLLSAIAPQALTLSLSPKSSKENSLNGSIEHHCIDASYLLVKTFLQITGKYVKGIFSRQTEAH